MFVSHDGHVRGYKWIYTYFVQNIVLHDKSIERERDICIRIRIQSLTYSLLYTFGSFNHCDRVNRWLGNLTAGCTYWPGDLRRPCLAALELSWTVDIFFLHPQAQDQMLSICFLCVSSWQPIYRPSFCTRLGQFKMNEMVFCWGKTIVFFLVTSEKQVWECVLMS